LQPYSPEASYALLERLRVQRPLVQNITNYVAMTLSANVLLALGASPAMVHAEGEAEEFTGIASSLVINIGTLSQPWVTAMWQAARAARKGKKPWVLDPVGVGATAMRNRACADLMGQKPTAIRGNAGEIMALGGIAGATRGVDSTAGSDAAIATAKALALSSGAIVSVTGETDYVTDGKTVVAIDGGHALMPLSTALGCALSATVGAFLAVEPTLEAVVAAHAVYGAAGRIAGGRVKGPGHLPAELCDALHALNLPALKANSSTRIVEG